MRQAGRLVAEELDKALKLCQRWSILLRRGSGMSGTATTFRHVVRPHQARNIAILDGEVNKNPAYDGQNRPWRAMGGLSEKSGRASFFLRACCVE